MNAGDRRAWGASIVVVLGGVVLTTLGLWPDGNAADGWVPGRTWSAPAPGTSTGPDAAARPTTLVMPDGSVVVVLPSVPVSGQEASTGSGSQTGMARPPKPSWGHSTTPTSTPTAAPTLRPPPTSAPTPRPTAAATPTPPPAGACPVFPSTNVWNADISGLPVASNSATMVAAIGLTSVLHPDFSSTAYNGGLGYGIPFNKVNLSTPTYHVTFDYADESDPGPYPIPPSPRIEGGSDRHLILWDTQGCNLYEIYDAVHAANGWTGGSGAIWDLTSNALRPSGWTSADAAGLPILPGLVRYDEVVAGAILHALRFTAPHTCAGHIYPARHDAGSGSCSTYPPMGLRVRLKASISLSGFGPQARVILTALKRYGMILADNGSPWYVTGAPNASWNDDELHVLQTLHGSDFEVVDTSNLR